MLQHYSRYADLAFDEALDHTVLVKNATNDTNIPTNMRKVPKGPSRLNDVIARTVVPELVSLI